MSAPVRPDTEKEQLAQIWQVLVGMNGDGIVSKVNQMYPIVIRLEDQHKHSRTAWLTYIPAIIASAVALFIAAYKP